MKKVFYLTVLAKDARDAQFTIPTNCLLSRAVQRMFPDVNPLQIKEVLDFIRIGFDKYSHRWFCSVEFNRWVDKAKGMKDEEVLFKIKLTKVE
jgi:hypothetical protein